MTSDLRITVDGETFRVVVVRDVLALPDHGWSRGSFGNSIDAAWLMAEGRLPGAKPLRQRLARALVCALNVHHGQQP